LIPKQRLIMLKQSTLSSLLARRLCFVNLQRKFSRNAELSILRRRNSFELSSPIIPNPTATKVVGCILPLQFTAQGSLTNSSRWNNQPDYRFRSADHPFLPFRFKCEPDNTVNVYFTANGCEILVLSVPFMQQI